MVSVPSTYSKVYERDLIKNGFKLVIYANQLLRAAYPAMEKVALNILKNKRSFESEKEIISIKKIFLEVSGLNKTAIKFYEKNGFKIIGIRQNYYTLKNNSKVDGYRLLHEL